MNSLQSEGDALHEQLADKKGVIKQQQREMKKKETQSQELNLNILKNERKKANIRSKIAVTKKQQIEFWYNIIF